MDLADIARLWGLDAGTVRRYKHEGRLPEPDAAVGTGPGRRLVWRPETVQSMVRAGRGARTDLRRVGPAAISTKSGKDEHFQRIRDAALGLFVRHGTEAVSLRTIAKNAGVSVGSVQYRFVNKANLIDAVDDHVMMVLTNSLASPLASAPGDPVTDAADRVTSLFSEHTEVVSYLCRALIDGAPIGVRVFDSLVKICTGYWAQIQEQGLTRPDLDPIWMVLNPLTLVLGMFMLNSHLSRHLPESLTTPAQLRRWRDATEVIIGSGQLQRRQRPTSR